MLEECVFWCWSPASPWTDHCRLKGARDSSESWLKWLVRPQACEDCSFGQNAGGKKNVWTIFGSGDRKKHARDRGWEFSSSTNIKKQVLKKKTCWVELMSAWANSCIRALGNCSWRGCARFKSVVVGLGSLSGWWKIYLINLITGGLIMLIYRVYLGLV